ncbi:hypothetical protein HRI_002183000 [Hibiscus trionum]|uniref:TF-B3 domain-containing protein n=1 Tax=Hibiscus trionum TaxID=183268 RepID=A0A9W7HY80_HIBTR|nr:hypothetical protein HRI_002183000 [Hibiscus trionum]
MNKDENVAKETLTPEEYDDGVALTQDEYDAAFVLLYLKYRKSDEKTALELDTLERKFLEGKDRPQDEEEPSSDVHGRSEILESSSRPCQKRWKRVRFFFKKNQNQEPVVVIRPQPQDENVAKETLTPEEDMRERSLPTLLRWGSSKRRSNKLKLRDEEQSNRCCIPEYSYMVEAKVTELLSSDPCSSSKPFLFSCKTMKEECEKNQSKSMDNDNSGGERWWTDEEYSVAEALVSLQYAKFDKQSAVELKKRKRDDEQEAPRLIIIGGRNNRVLADYEPPDFPPVPTLSGLITECSKPYEKRLTETDLKRDQTRLLLCKDHVRQFMIPLLKQDENVRTGIPVTVYDPEGNEYDMKFKLWSSNMYVLTSNGWIRFCKQHGLVKDIDTVSVWMFRHRVTQKLCFVITSRRSPTFLAIDKAKTLIR